MSDFKYYLRYAFGKLLMLIAYIITALTLVFFVINLMPGDPAYSLAVYYMQTYNLKFEQALEMARAALGYDVSKPVHVRYLEYLARLARGELGFSLYYRRPAVEVIALSLPWTLLVLMLATILSYVVGTRLGVFAAFKRGRAVDSALYSAAIVMLSLPPFIIAVIVLYVLGVNLKLIPLGGAYALGVKPGLNLPFLLSVLQHAAGPVLAQALVQLSGWLLSARNVSVTILAEDFVKYGVARGLKRGTLTKKYIWKPARLPILTSLALSFGYMLGGSTLVESVFRYPGIGQQLGLALGSRDFGLAISIFTIMVIAVILASFLIELLYPLLDPRVRGA